MKKPLDERKKKSHTTLLGQKKVLCIYWIPQLHIVLHLNIFPVRTSWAGGKEEEWVKGNIPPCQTTDHSGFN